ncbi:MAG: serine hydrolase [Chloroflexi bacterium]|nr:serine hydrolase [Chloroflexota bacterium]
MIKRVLLLFTAVLLLFSASWYLFPKQFYLFDALLAGLVPWEIVTPDPTIDTIEALDAFISDQLSSHDVPGTAVAIIANGDIVWEKGYGYANLTTETAVTPHTPFHLGSVSKAMMGVSIMHAVEAGLLDLDMEINDVLPFDVVNPAAPNTPITLRHLVSHTSGIQDSKLYEQSYGVGDPIVSLGDFLRDYLTMDGDFYDADDNFTGETAGAAYEYSNIASGLAGYVLEMGTGQPLNVYAREQIFTPLGMNNSGYFLSEFDDVNAIAMPYVRRGTPFGHVGYPTWPDGMMRASVHDVAVVLTAVMNNDIYQGTRILTPESVQILLNPTVPRLPQHGVFWETAVSDLSRALFAQSIVGHSGSDPGASTFMYFNPETQLGAVILMNSDTHAAEEAGINILRQILDSEGTRQMFLP